MDPNPVLVEFSRADTLENLHRGAFCVVDDAGTVLASAGDIDRPVFPRSAIKSMQALALFRSGAVDKFDLTDKEIALACASHQAEPVHVEVAAGLLARLGLTIDDLECGAHAPGSATARKALAERGESPTAIHNNCSGKHAGMLADALALGVPTADYAERNHPVQKMVRRCIEEVIGTPLTSDHCGRDGCSIPTWAAPLRAFAKGFAKMVSGRDLAPDLAAAAPRIFDAATGNPVLVRGEGTLDTELMTAFAGRLMLKIGAEGVYCGALRDKGWGFALKIDDGKKEAAETLIANLLFAISDPNADEAAALEKYLAPVSTNWRGFEVAKTQATDLARPKIG